MNDDTTQAIPTVPLGPGDLLDSAVAGGQWWTGTWDGAGEKAKLTIAVDDTLYDFGFRLTSPTSALVRFDISEHQGGLSPASSSPMNGWVTWASGEFALAMEGEEGSLANTWERDHPFGDDNDVYELPDDAAVAGFARLAAEIFLSPELYADDETRARLLGAEAPE